MNFTKETRMSKSTNRGTNLIYYVSDMEEIPAAGHFRKMDAGREIAMHICNGLDNAVLKKYTEYEGERIEASSVGIVFPTHMWGISLAVYSFLKHLRVSKDTYVYAVVVGESLSGSVDATLGKRLSSMERFNRIFVEKGFGDENNIFMRSIDFKRDYDTTEESLRGEKNNIVRLQAILEGLLFYSIETMKTGEFLDKDDFYVQRAVVGFGDEYISQPVVRTEDAPVDRTLERIRLSNVYLDEAMLSGVRLCRVM